MIGRDGDSRKSLRNFLEREVPETSELGQKNPL